MFLNWLVNLFKNCWLYKSFIALVFTSIFRPLWLSVCRDAKGHLKLAPRYYLSRHSGHRTIDGKSWVLKIYLYIYMHRVSMKGRYFFESIHFQGTFFITVFGNFGRVIINHSILMTHYYYLPPKIFTINIFHENVWIKKLATRTSCLHKDLIIGS